MKKICVLIIMLVASVSLKAQYLVDGESLDNIQIGKSTIGDVIANYGSDYKLKKNSDYSNALVYEKLGLIFYSCQDDPNRQIFVIVMQSPFNVRTSKGIILGKSTFKDLAEAYGQWSNISGGYEYEATGLYFDNDGEVYKNFEIDNTNFAPPEKQSSKTLVYAENNSDSQNNDSVILSNSSIQSNDSYVVSNDNSESSNQSDIYAVSQNSGIDDDADSSDADESSTDDDEEFKSDLKAMGNKIVKRIELIEKGRLRQCHEDFRTQQ